MLHNLKILQINANHTSLVTENVLELAIEHNIDLIFIQEPSIINSEALRLAENWENANSTSHTSFSQIWPTNSNPKNRPRVMLYYSNTLPGGTISKCPTSPDDPDCLIIKFAQLDRIWQFVNIYNQTDQLGVHGTTLNRVIYNELQLQPYTVLLGDFNLKHPDWDPNHEATAPSSVFAEWVTQNSLVLQNAPGTPTFFRPNQRYPSVLDLTYTTEIANNYIIDWQTLDDTGSDHKGVMFTLNHVIDQNLTSAIEKFNVEKADWTKFNATLASTPEITQVAEIGCALKRMGERNELSQKLLQNSNHVMTSLLDDLAQSLSNGIISAARASMPLLSKHPTSKPWWTPELKALRRIMNRKARDLKDDPHDRVRYRVYTNAKATYFKSIQRAKSGHWNAFLEREDPKSIYRALKYTKAKDSQAIPPLRPSTDHTTYFTNFEEQAKCLKETLFPPPPVTAPPDFPNYTPKVTWPNKPLDHTELKLACITKIKGTTPGPDLITHPIIQKAYLAIPETFYIVFSNLIDIGYHPKCWKQAIGCVLKKQKKPDYSIPKAYRVISLLNCLGKVSERILAQRLAYLAETTNLIHDSQIGGRLKKSGIDAAVLLTSYVQDNKRRGLVTSTAFMDVKGAYDHVAHMELVNNLMELGLPYAIITWVLAFLSDRLLKLSFNGQIEEFQSIISGIPQGSPISPILFLIYIRKLFDSGHIYYLSYVDDITISYASTSVKKNTKLLQLEVNKITQLATKFSIAFDHAKTELMHWTGSSTTRKEHANLTMSDGTNIKPSKSIVWLGIHFDHLLKFSSHVKFRAAKALQAFHRMSRLVNIGRGLSTLATRQIYMAAVVGSSDYGTELWKNPAISQTAILAPLVKLQNKALRKILGVFKTAPITPMELEAATPPVEVRLNSSIRKYAFRLKKLAPNHPVNKAIILHNAPYEDADSSDTEPETPGSSQDPQIKKNQKFTQTQIVHRSIAGLYNGSILERIKHFNFAPWNKDLPYKINISKASKTDQAKIHNSEVTKVAKTKTTLIYSDASSMPGPKSLGVGVGLIAAEWDASPEVFDPFLSMDGPGADFESNDIPDHVVYQNSSNLGPNQLVYNGELEGVTQALEYASTLAPDALAGRTIKIYSDNQAGLWRLNKPSDNPGQSHQIRAISAGRKITSQGAHVTIEWVPGHKDVIGNELADALAKNGTTQPPDKNETSFAMLGMKISQIGTSEWGTLAQAYKDQRHKGLSYANLYHIKTRGKIALGAGIPREIASAFFQLKLGHGYNKAYMKRINQSEYSNCRCGFTETPVHLLMYCTFYTEARDAMKKAFFNKIPLTLRTLMDTPNGVSAALSFIKDTKISTRLWHLWRDEEEVAEGAEAGETEEEGGGRPATPEEEWASERED